MLMYSKRCVYVSCGVQMWRREERFRVLHNEATVNFREKERVPASQQALSLLRSRSAKRETNANKCANKYKQVHSPA